MGLVHFLIVFLVVAAIIGLVLWGISRIPNLPPVILTILYVVVGVILLLWLLSAVTGGGSLSLKL